MTDINIGDEFEDSFEVEQNRNAYIVVEFGDGYYPGPPIAVFFSEESAHIFKENNEDADRVIESNCMITSKDDWLFQSKHNYNKKQVMDIISRQIETKDKFNGSEISQLIEDYNIRPEHLRDESEVNRVAKHIFFSHSDTPEHWEEPVESFSEEYYQK